MSDDDIKRHEFLEEKLHGQASHFQSLIFQLLQTRYLVYIFTRKLPSYKADCLKKNRDRDALSCRPGGLQEL